MKELNVYDRKVVNRERERVYKLLDQWVGRIGQGFHLDTKPSGYSPRLPKKMSAELSRDLADVFDTCDTHGIDAYEVALAALTAPSIGTKFSMHSSMQWSKGAKNFHHEFDNECVVTKVDEWNVSYKVVAQSNETNRPPWQKNKPFVFKTGGFSRRYTEIRDGALVRVG